MEAVRQIHNLERARQSFLKMDTPNFTSEQLQAFVQSCKRVLAYNPGDRQLWGLYQGLIEVAADFDAPLPDDFVELFYGVDPIFAAYPVKLLPSYQ